MITISEQIRLIARRAGLSMSKLAAATGQTPQNLNNKLRRDNFTVKELQAIAAAAAGVTVNIIWTDNNGKAIF